MSAAAAVLALTRGRRVESLTGTGRKGGDGSPHAGITNTVAPILAVGADAIKEIRNRAASTAGSGDHLVVDFTDCAQRSSNHDDHASLLATSTNEIIIASA